MTDIFKCNKKSGTQCCAPKSKIQEHQLRHNASIPYPGPFNHIVGYDHYATPAPAPIHLNTFSYETQQTTTTSRPPIYSKYVCGVKGTSRNGGRSYLTYQAIFNDTDIKPRHAR